MPDLMVKRVRPDSKQEQNKGREEEEEDRISLLPDEILIFILSLLKLKEAAVTSVLSRRWGKLWAYIPSLDFDAIETLVDKLPMKYKLLEMERGKYTNWVNQVLRLHKGPTLEEFRICFDLDKTSQADIDKWLQFVVAKRVQSLVLVLQKDGCCLPRDIDSYTFPYEMLSQSKWTSIPPNSSIMPHCAFVGFKSLRALCLKCVNVSGEVLDYFLSNCKLLERLCVHASRELVNLRVAGLSVSLKYLEICHCKNIKSIEICNENLVTLIYAGHMMSLVLENAPLLVELSIDGFVTRSLTSFLPRLSCCFSQLEILTLGAHQEIAEFHVSAKLTSLKTLVLNSLGSADKSLLQYTSFIRASPFLRKFVLQTRWLGPKIDERKVRRKRGAARYPHEYLEEVEFAGYYGLRSDVELVMYFLENAIALKKIIIDPRSHSPPEFLRVFPKRMAAIEEERAARSRAKQQLERIVPLSIELVIL